MGNRTGSPSSPILLAAPIQMNEVSKLSQLRSGLDLYLPLVNSQQLSPAVKLETVFRFGLAHLKALAKIAEVDEERSLADPSPRSADQHSFWLQASNKLKDALSETQTATAMCFVDINSEPTCDPDVVTNWVNEFQSALVGAYNVFDKIPHRDTLVDHTSGTHASGTHASGTQCKGQGSWMMSIVRSIGLALVISV